MATEFSRRSFIKGLAMGTAGLGLCAILPGGIITAATAAQPKQEIGKNGAGIYIDGLAENMKDKRYTLQFVQPIKLVAFLDGKAQTEGTWRSSNKHLVSVGADGTVIMRDGVGGYDVDVTWTLGENTFKVTFHTAQNCGSSTITVDSPMTRGAFMIRLAKYFGWPHYNAVMDDGTDIDDNGNVMTTERVRNYFDVTGDAEYVKPIEAALEMGVLKASSSSDTFRPMEIMTRQDAAQIIYDAFHMSPLDTDYLGAFSDIGSVSKDRRTALNTLVGRNFMRGRTNSTLNPTDGITDTEARIIIESIDARVTAPVWSMPVSNRKFVRCRPEWFTSTEDAVVHWRVKCDKYSHPEYKGLFVQDRGVGFYVGTGWSDWFDYIPGYTTDPCFALNNNYDLPYDATWLIVDVEAYATKSGLEDSPVTTFKWRVERPAWHDFAIDVLHDAGPSFPKVYRFFDNFQAAAYYIEGSNMGILYDSLQPTHTTTSLIDRVEEIAKPGLKKIFVLGHNHVDHVGNMPYAYEKGWDIYLCDRAMPKDAEYTVQTYNRKYTSANPVVDEEHKGTYSGDKVHYIDEGYVFDLGNCKFETYRLPGHEDAMMILFDRENGLMFSSDIYAVNRYWVADQFSATGVRQDLLLSIQQQLMDLYTKDGATVRELYTGHNRVGVGGDYLTIWEQCLQKLVDYGPDGVEDDRRGDGAIVARDGDMYETMNWTAFAESGKMVRAEYKGTYDGKIYHRIEVDNRGTQNPLVSSNLYYDYRTNAHLSDIYFFDAQLVGHDFKYKTGFDSANDVLEDGRMKYVLVNKFFPDDTDYEVKIGGSQTSVTFTPVAMSNRIKGMTVNGKPASSRCPVTVSTSTPATIVVTGPDGSTKCTYTLKFVKG